MIIIGASAAAVVLFIAILWLPVFNPVQQIEFGVSFSKTYAEFLGLDWQKTYLAILDDLGAKNLRLQSEWDETELIEGVYNFEALDWQIAEAEKRGVKVLLVVGERQPRWPECHIPAWLSGAPQEKLREKTLAFVRTAVERYKNSPAVFMWQVENEPLFNLFGKCPKSDKQFLQKEIDLVRSMDSRPILITDSGELSTWRKTARLGDYFGTTVYRSVYNSYFGYFYHFWPPAFYRLKARLVGLPCGQAIISELQVEPWVRNGSIPNTPIEEQKEVMGLKRIENHINFARKTGFSPAYLWGVEWWYWMGERGEGAAWEMGKGLWK